MAHGYLGDGYGSHGDIGDDRSDERDRDWRERGWRGQDRDWRERDDDRGMMFGGGRNRDWSDDDRWSDRSSGSEGFRGERGFGNSRVGFGSGRDQGGSGDSPGRRSFSAHPDDHYRSWRDRHIGELDRDYQDYCREREQQFHREFDDWRRQKYGNPQPLRTGMTQTGMSHDPSGEYELTNEASTDPSGSDPVADATLGTNSSGTRGGGRSRR
jgi:hypothetical protein